MVKNSNGFTLIELLIVIVVISIVGFLVAPGIGRFNSSYSVRNCATDLIQYMRTARAMAIKENREYLIVFQLAGDPNGTVNPQGRFLIGFDGDSPEDNDLLSVSADTFGICKDTDGDRLPNNDSDADGDGVPDCVRVINLSNCGNNVRFGTLASKDPNGDNITCNGKTVCFGSTSNPIRADFNPDGSAGNLGSVYFEHNNVSGTGRGYSYLVRVSNSSGSTNMWKWDGDNENAANLAKTTWTEIR